MTIEEIKKKRREVTDFVVKAMTILEPSGFNAKQYKDFYNSMTDKQFHEHMMDFLDDRTQQYYIETVEYEREITLESVTKCAEFIGIDLFEDVVLPVDQNGNQSVTPEPVPVGYVHIRRMPQTLLSKSSGSLDIDKRDTRTWQVTGDDKNARNSDMETFGLVAIGADQVLREFMGPRADDMTSKYEFYNEISKNGFVSLNDLTNDTYNKGALNSLDVYYLIQGITTNLVSELDEIPGPRKR